MGEYERLGVDPGKKAAKKLARLVRAARRGFADVLEGWARGEGLVLHVDGAGSKPLVSYLYYRETGSYESFKTLMQDVLAMNVNDAAAVAAEPELFADYLAYNSLVLDGEKLAEKLGEGLEEALALSSSLGGAPRLAGGETAELPDQTLTLDLVGVLLGRAPLEGVVDGSRIRPGQAIIGVRSGGKARWENRENSGIMCNGLTLARHVLLSPRYRDAVPEAFPSRPPRGRFSLDDKLEGTELTVGEALLSPTRFYHHLALEAAKTCSVSGMVHVTGGGHTKILRLGRGLHYVLDSLPEPDPIFKLIVDEAGISWREAYRVFNMGIGFEIIADKSCADKLLSISEKAGLEALIIGRVEESPSGINKLTIRTPWAQKLSYSAPPRRAKT